MIAAMKIFTKLICGIGFLLLTNCTNPIEVVSNVGTQPSITAVVPTTTLLPATPTAAPTIVQTATPTSTPTTQPTQTPIPPPTATATPAYPLYTGVPLNKDKIGLQIHIHQENLPLLFDHIQTIGAGWVKIQLSWKLYQPQPDAYDNFRWAELDEAVAMANERNIAVLLSVAKAPEWSRSTTELDGPPQDYTLYGSFMRFIAERYQGRVAAYELWNEPNLRREWNGDNLHGANFIELIRHGAAGVRTVDEQVILISGAPAPTGINDGETAVADRLFLRQMLEANFIDVVDAIGIHPYGWANPPDTTVAVPDPAVPTHQNHPTFFFKDTINDYAALLAEFGAADMPMWGTEFGWGSYDGWDAAPPASVPFMADVTAWQQAVYTLRAFELAQANPQIGPMILWNLNFGPLLGPKRSESGFSILARDGSPRPVYHALAAAPKQ